jgi:UDP-glucose 4-epimerase
MSEPLLSGRTVLVTGGAGFIGGHLVDALVPDNDVRVLDADVGPDAEIPEGVDVHEVDVRDEDALASAAADVDVIFHEAAVVSVERSLDDPLGTNDVNLQGTLNVLEAARREDARVVFASSAAVYGTPERVPIVEGDATKPLSPYGLQKLAADEYVRLYHDRYGLPAIPLRYFNAYGPGSAGGEYAGVITAFRQRIAAGEPPIVHGDGTQTRDFVHVDDVVRANLRAATTDAVGQAYNVGTGDSVTIRELAEILLEVAEVDVPIEHGPPRPGDVPESEADIARARADLGYEPQVRLTDGLRDLVAGEEDDGR